MCVNIQLFGGRGGGFGTGGGGGGAGVGKVPSGTGSMPQLNRELTGERYNQLEDYAEQYQRDHRSELKQYGIKRSGFIANWEGVGGVHIWSFDGDTKNGSTSTTVLNNGFVTKFYTKGMNELLGVKTYKSLDTAINGAKKFLGHK